MSSTNVVRLKTPPHWRLIAERMPSKPSTEEEFTAAVMELKKGDLSKKDLNDLETIVYARLNDSIQELLKEHNYSTDAYNRVLAEVAKLNPAAQKTT